MAIKVGTNGNDVIMGTDGDDILIGDGGSDSLDADDSDMLDNILTSIDEDIETIEGTDGKDTLTGGKEDNLIFGQENNDVIKGGSGDDILSGGKGKDTLTGEKGANVFVLALDEGIDTITDFGQGDRILIEKSTFADTSTDDFSYDDFSYDEDTGELFFESPVKGAKAVQIATLPANLGSTFDAEKDIIFDEIGIINGLNSESRDISKDRQAFLDDLLADLSI